VRFLVDNQLPAALASFLSARGAACDHVLDLNLSEASDTKIWDFADQNDYVVISKDEDFLYLANSRPSNARLIWVRLGNCRTKVLLEDIDLLWPKIEAALRAGERIIEVRQRPK
jgi:predicted nuclease of predicted toxin-antitoxin system